MSVSARSVSPASRATSARLFSAAARPELSSASVRLRSNATRASSRRPSSRASIPSTLWTCASACWSVASRGDVGRERGGAVVLADLVQREAEVGEDARAQAVVGARFERDRVARLRAVPLAAPLVDAAELVLDARDVVR